MCDKLALSRAERILDYDQKILDDPENSNARTNRRELLNKWYEKDVEIMVQVANNEQRQWTEFEIGLPTEKMKTKLQTGYDQVGDYNFTATYQSTVTLGGLVAERKSGVDMLGSLSQKERYVNLNQELARFNADPRFSRYGVKNFHIFAECTLGFILNSRPPKVVHYLKIQKNPNYKPKAETTRLRDHRNSMKGKIWTLAIRGAPISWEGSRQEAALSYNFAVRHWCTKNHRIIMGVDDEIHN